MYVVVAKQLYHCSTARNNLWEIVSQTFIYVCMYVHVVGIQEGKVEL